MIYVVKIYDNLYLDTYIQTLLSPENLLNHRPHNF